ncbi:MAG: peptide-methionine (R)-S-oxide reductase MsrB [Gammaproteobacteria bacterium]|nr:MAG: peptide-methionine (R)-S-oxide reductase MsrB [Gammaproteobacteria bacterium]
MSDTNCKTEEEWQLQLTPEQFEVTRRKGTERAFTGKYHDCKAGGVYHCVCCGAPLFSSDEKFDSGSGWPSYWQPVSEQAVRSEEDRSHGMKRVEVLCAQCEAHLGHVFEDGPQPTGLRYCINSIALNLKEK